YTDQNEEFLLATGNVSRMWLDDRLTAFEVGASFETTSKLQHESTNSSVCIVCHRNDWECRGLIAGPIRFTGNCFDSRIIYYQRRFGCILEWDANFGCLIQTLENARLFLGAHKLAGYSSRNSSGDASWHTARNTTSNPANCPSGDSAWNTTGHSAAGPLLSDHSISSENSRRYRYQDHKCCY